MSIEPVKDDTGSGTGLFAVANRMDERLAEYGWPLNKHLLLPQNTFDKAHTVMMLEQGIITRDEAAQILRALQAVDQLGPSAFPWGKGDLWTNKERYVITQIGEAVGGKLHTGRSRQDVGNTTTRLYVRTKVLNMATELLQFRRNLLSLAERHLETVMPCYTWTQQAQPTTFGHYLVAIAYAMARNSDRIRHAFELTNMGPAGAALQGGTSHRLDRRRTNTLMGFAAPIRNTRDAAVNFDFLLDILTSASITFNDMLRMLEDFSLWHSLEFNMISLDDVWCGTSSIMPQKRNPYPFMVIRGKAAKVFARSTASLGTLEGPTLGPPVPFYMQTEVDEVINEFIGAFVLANGFLPTLRVNVAIMRERAGEFWAQATDLADAIVKEKGLSFRTAHHIVAELVRIADESVVKPAVVDSKLLNQAADNIIGRPLNLVDETLRNALDPEYSFRTRNVLGGTDPEDVKEQIRECRDRLENDSAQIHDCVQQISAAEVELDAAVSAIVG